MKQFGIDIPNSGVFIIVVCSKWCRSCKLLNTVLERFRNEGAVSSKEIDLGESNEIVQKLNINAVPALIFFKDGKLFDKSFSINGEILVNKGVMIGSFNESILKEIIKSL